MDKPTKQRRAHLRRRARDLAPVDGGVEFALRCDLRRRQISIPEQALIDGMEPAERALVYEYGFRRVLAARDAGCGGTLQMEQWLKRDREKRQEKLLRTKVTK